MKKLSLYLIIIFLVIVIYPTISKGEFMNTKNEEIKTIGYKVKDITTDGNILLSNNRQICLIGIEKTSFNSKLNSFIRSLVSDKYVVFMPETMVDNLGYLYIIGLDIEKLPIKIENKEPEITGFLNLKVGFSSRKAIGYNLNAILIKSGYVRLDQQKDFKYREYFNLLEESAKKNRIGIWKD